MTKRIQSIRAGRFDQVPPYCYLQPGMSPEDAALATARALELTHPLDLLNVLWILRRAIVVAGTASHKPKQSNHYPLEERA
jgi:hypothetical protein